MTLLRKAFGTQGRGWLPLLLALTVAAMAIFALQAFQPGVIQDDARQFLAWTPRLFDPSLLKGDLIADYWYSVTPAPFRLPYQAMALLGVSAPTTGSLIALVLLPLSTIMAWTVARRLTPTPVVAFLAAGVVMAFVLQDNSIFSGTPRSVTVPVLLLFFLGLIDDRPLPMLGGLGLLSLLYPAPAITCLGIVCLSRLRLFPRPGIDLSRRSILLVVAAMVVALGPALLFDAGVSRWEPTLKFADFHQFGSMATPTGRSTIVTEDGKAGWICGVRLGFLPAIASCKRTQYGLSFAVDLALFLIMAWSGWRGLKSADRNDPRRVYALAIASSAFCWGVATAVMFKLHLPSRFSQRVLTPLEALAVGVMVGEWLAANAARLWAKLVGGALLAAMVYCFVQPFPKMLRVADPAGMAVIAALPKDARIAGVADDLNFVPAMAGRAVIADTEHAIPYQLGYYLPFRARLFDSVELATTPDRAAIATLIRKNGITAVLVEHDVLRTGRLPKMYRQSLPEAVREIIPHAPALGGAPAACHTYDGPNYVIFDAPCLVGWSETTPRTK